MCHAQQRTSGLTQEIRGDGVIKWLELRGDWMGSDARNGQKNIMRTVYGHELAVCASDGTREARSTIRVIVSHGSLAQTISTGG